MAGRGKRSLRTCGDGHSSGGRKDLELSHSPLVSRGERGHGLCRQLGDDEGRAATSSLFVWRQASCISTHLSKPACCCSSWLQVLHWSLCPAVTSYLCDLLMPSKDLQ